MSSKNSDDGPDRGEPAAGSFADYGGALELDLPPARELATAPEAPAPEAPEGDLPRRPERAGRPPLTARPFVREDPVRIKPLLATESRGRGMAIGVRLFLLGLLGVGTYGGYYGYCVYKVAEKERAFSVEAQELRQALLKATQMSRPARPADLRAVVLEFASRSGVLVQPDEIRVTIEPLSESSVQKLPSIARMAMGIVGKMPRYERPPWVVGFEANLLAQHGPARERFTLSRYTYLESAEP